MDCFLPRMFSSHFFLPFLGKSSCLPSTPHPQVVGTLLKLQPALPLDVRSTFAILACILPRESSVLHVVMDTWLSSLQFAPLLSLRSSDVVPSALYPFLPFTVIILLSGFSLSHLILANICFAGFHLTKTRAQPKDFKLKLMATQAASIGHFSERLPSPFLAPPYLGEPISLVSPFTRLNTASLIEGRAGRPLMDGIHFKKVKGGRVGWKGNLLKRS